MLSFNHGSATLSVIRRSAGITGMLLLVGTSTDTQAAAAGTKLAQDLVTAQFGKVRRAFDGWMRAGLPSARLRAITVTVTSHLRTPAEVAAQITVHHGLFTVVETYLLFRNGLRRVEVTLDEHRKVAGLYLRAI